MTYETWDHIADSVVPLLGLLTLLVPWFSKSQSGQTRTSFYVRLALAWGATIALRALNHSQWAVWPLMGASYSGHTGVFMALAVSLAAWNVRWAWLGIIILVLYGQLMIFQRYHSFSDIFVTALAMGPVTWAIQRTLTKQTKNKTTPTHSISSAESQSTNDAAEGPKN